MESPPAQVALALGALGSPSTSTESRRRTDRLQQQQHADTCGCVHPVPQSPHFIHCFLVEMSLRRINGLQISRSASRALSLARSLPFLPGPARESVTPPTRTTQHI